MYKCSRFLASVVFISLAACSPDQPAAVAITPEPVAPAPQPASETPVPAGFHYSPLPEGAVLKTAFHVRHDRFYTTKAGVKRRRAALELLEGDATTVAAGLGQSLTENGYRAMELEDRGDGITRTAFRKNGYGRINISATSVVGEKPANPEAVGVVAIDWPIAPPVSRESEDVATSSQDATAEN